ncbi:protocadherin alpha-6-like [Hyperolius riggenbachi]|uniref:protocadherin alpha-6-like n=1 Tax=Hyperolius riggenbachi TaxID=752182 RepID=UPI0035A2B9C1
MFMKHLIYFLISRLCIFITMEIAAKLVSCQLHYVVPEESKHGTFVGRLAQDLGMQISDINSRRLRIISKDDTDYFQVNLQNGILFINRVIDREKMCPKIHVCIVQLEVIVDKPVQIHHIDIEIEDINDNYPVFFSNIFKIVIAESRLPGSHFPLDGAVDADVGTNSVTSYELTASEYFAIDVQTYTQHSKSVQLVLKKSLDREKISFYNLTLTAYDGGKPKLSGTAQLLITVQDVNDNAPTFNQLFYKVNVLENAPKGTIVTKLNATDMDEGENSEIYYSFNKLVPQQVISFFSIEQNTGIIRVEGNIDYETTNLFEIEVDAVDKGHYPLAGYCKVLVNIVDMNDNHPEMTVTSLNVPVPEDSPQGSVVAVIHVQDKDSGVNGKVNCHIAKTVPFAIKPTLREYFSLTVDGQLDREHISQYDIEITATDEGSPCLSVTKTIKIEISDVNDNSPTFPQISEVISLRENNPPGLHIYTVSALDPDMGQNSFITYSISDSMVEGVSISSYISINPENGKMFALMSFDHEHTTQFNCKIKAMDAGLPPRSGEVILHIFIEDINDNAPIVLSPVINLESEAKEVVLRSAKSGYLVTKIKTIDADSGYNAWITYEIRDPARNSPFTVGLHTGDITVARPILESDGDEHRLTIVLKDHGEPAMSMTMTLVLLFVEPGQDFTAEKKEERKTKDEFSETNIYLILSICLISGIFLITLVMYTVLKWHNYTQEMDDFKRNTKCPSIARSWTYSQQRQYKVCLKGGPPTNDLILFTPNYPQTPTGNINSTIGSLATGIAGVAVI